MGLFFLNDGTNRRIYDLTISMKWLKWNWHSDKVLEWMDAWANKWMIDDFNDSWNFKVHLHD